MIEFKEADIFAGAKKVFRCLDWSLAGGESAIVLGENGSGKTSFCQALADKGFFRGALNLIGLEQKDISLVSYEEYKALVDWDNRFDDSEHVEGGKDFGRSVGDILRAVSNDEVRMEELLTEFSMTGAVDTGLRYLSSGESRKLIFIRELLKKPKLLLLDCPFDGLDKAMSEELKSVLQKAMKDGQQVLLFVRAEREIFDGFDKSYLLADGVFTEQLSLVKDESISFDLTEEFLYKTTDKGEELVRMEGVKVSYQGREILNDIDWYVKQGEHWRLSGANGCGKSTLLTLVTADNPQGYGQELYLFGRKRGTGESIWDIKRQIGLVNSEIHQKLQQRIKAFEVVISGIFDSIGLFDPYNIDQKMAAEAWMDFLQIEGLHDKYFHELSFGEQRLLLIARALVKKPKVLILDEPCQGVDDHNRERILALLKAVVDQSDTTLLYVSHVDEGELPFIDHEMMF